MTSFVTKERYAEMKAKFKELYGEIGGSVSINITINGEDYSGEVNPFIKELIEMGEGVNSSCIVRVGASQEEVRGVVDSALARKKPSPPPPPPMRKYKTSFFGFVDVLVNQDEIDAHSEAMKEWREENLK